MFSNLSTKENDLLLKISNSLGVDSKKLWALIAFESNWRPDAINKISGARGLIQWTNTTAKGLGFKSADDLYNKNKTILEQLNIVYTYLNRFKPFLGDQSLFMAVFYPLARTWPDTKIFPDSVLNANPGVINPASYIKAIYKKISLLYFPNYIFLGIGVVLGLIILSKEK